MSNVVHTAILALLQKLYKPIARWALATLATKTELSQNEADHFHPVNISSLTPSSTFGKNSVIGINGVLYRSLRATSNFPVVLTVQDGAFVVDLVNGKKSFVVSDPTVNQDWEIWTDASIEYWVESLNAALSSKQSTISDIDSIRSNASAAIKPSNVYTVNNVEYTVDELLQAVASLMNKTVVIQS